MRRMGLSARYGANNPEPPAMRLPDVPGDVSRDSLHAAEEYINGPYFNSASEAISGDNNRKRDG